jgi:hypothetical protein
MTYNFKFHYHPPIDEGRFLSVTITGQDGAITQGWSFCVAGDPFVKETGRRISITRAIEFFPREVRKAVWASYWASKLPKETK